MALALSLTGCDAGMQVDRVAMDEPPVFSETAVLAPLRFGAMQLRLPRGRVVGTYRDGLECLDGGRQIWWNSARTALEDVAFEDLFFDQMRLAGYDMRGDPSALFPVRPDRQAAPPYVVSGQVEDLRMNLCDIGDLLTGRPTYMQTGKASVRVYWQIYDSLARSVVMEGRSEGYGEIIDPMPEAQSQLIAEAFASSVANLAASPDLSRLVATPRTDPAEQLRRRGGERRSIARVPPFQGPLSNHADHVRQAVVTVESTTGHGSGFFIARDLLLTNFHVVEGIDMVRLILTTGGTTLGRVIRYDEARDIALIQVEPAGYAVLPLRTGPVQVAETVFAVGSPYRDGYRATVSQGVISRLTENDYGLPDIQADVTVMEGSSGGPLLDATGTVIGVTYAGEAAGDGAMRGLNRFIPVRAALDALGLQIRHANAASGAGGGE